jgi:hypothetical protein
MPGISDKSLSRAMGALSCSYFLWVFSSLWRHTGVFASLVAGLGADTPGPTRFVFDNYLWFYPLLFVAIAGIIIAQEFVVSSAQARLAVTLVVSLLALFVVDFIKSLLFLPLLTLIDQLS